jgi:hypothetical protein
VVHEQLTAAVEQLRERSRAVVGLEAVLLLDADPGKLAPQSRQLVAPPRVLLLLREQFLAGGGPVLTAHDLVIVHRRSSSALAAALSAICLIRKSR